MLGVPRTGKGPDTMRFINTMAPDGVGSSGLNPGFKAAEDANPGAVYCPGPCKLSP